MGLSPIMGVKPSILTSFKWQYVFVATMGHMVASRDAGSKWKQLCYFKAKRVSRATVLSLHIVILVVA